MSFESAKKYGYISSLLTVIFPVIALAVLLVVILPLSLTISIFSPDTAITTMVGILLTALIISLASVCAITFLFLSAMYRLSKHYNEPTLFMYPIYALIIGIAGAICTVIFQLLLYPIYSYTTFTALTTYPNTMLYSIFSIGINLLISISSGYLYMRTFNKLAEKSGVDNFKTAGLLYIIGAVLTIALVGGLIIWISWIFVTLGFRKLTPTPQTTAAPTTTVTGVPMGQNLYCPQCGTENPQYAIYCQSCGKQLK
ncbi:MAG: DUF996 domain-containing protein [Candidatus Bathyarchaeota archaeon]|nr:DUF996 domain-containing protein [Candidatus Bathyarchaeota archaeon]